MRDIIILNKQRIRKGEQAQISLNIAKLPTHTSIDLPVLVYRSMKDGPTLLLTGGLHGDEINGIEIVRRMIEKRFVIPEAGTVIAIPIVNVYGFIQSARGVPDGKDINRSFPGNKTGSLAKLVAYTIMKEIIPNIDIGLDFHTGGANRTNYPQLRLAAEFEKNVEIAQAFAAPVTLNSGLINQSFRKSAHAKGKPILVFETGESLRMDEFGIEEGIKGTLRVMKYLGMRRDAPAPKQSDWYSKSTWVRARNAGIFQSRVTIGDLVSKNQTLGLITDPFGNDSFNVRAQRQGRVVGLNKNPVVHKGDALMHLAFN